MSRPSLESKTMDDELLLNANEKPRPSCRRWPGLSCAPLKKLWHSDQALSTSQPGVWTRRARHCRPPRSYVVTLVRILLVLPSLRLFSPVPLLPSSPPATPNRSFSSSTSLAAISRLPVWSINRRYTSFGGRSLKRTTEAAIGFKEKAYAESARPWPLRVLRVRGW